MKEHHPYVESHLDGRCALCGQQQGSQEHESHQAEQPSPSKWAVEAATEVWRNNFDSDFVDWVLAHPKSYPNRTSEIQRDAAVIDRAITSALAERDVATGFSDDPAWVRIKTRLATFVGEDDALTTLQWMAKIERAAQRVVAYDAVLKEAEETLDAISKEKTSLDKVGLIISLDRVVSMAESVLTKLRSLKR